jgi:hypothetical protein
MITPDADPHTLRLIAEDLARQATQLKIAADRIEQNQRSAAERPLRPTRAARLANAYIFSGMPEDRAIVTASLKAKTTDAATRDALDRLKRQQTNSRKARLIRRALEMKNGGQSLREIAAALEMPKSTLADWLRATGADPDPAALRDA